MATLDRVPLHLRRYVVEQHHAAYSATDHAVWRFVLQQLYGRLRDTAHPAYADGLRRAGMSVDHIPRISEMDAQLAQVGWGAVCVDGFIPPRAFVEFQELAILPIAAEIRTRQHLAYTPAPDIIHEAAGHAPILPDSEYAALLRRFGAVGRYAFSCPSDYAVYTAIAWLSRVKEDPNGSEQQVDAALSELETQLRIAAQNTVSEATRLSRLYWWTAEYGLLGTTSDYKIYGAGLLSSLGESHSCHDAAVRKLTLSLACTERSYDITRPQPQLFVASSFGHVGDVLEQLAAGFAQRCGGARALSIAAASGEVASIEFAGGIELIAQIASADDGLLTISGAAALARAGQIFARLEPTPELAIVVPSATPAIEQRAAVLELGNGCTLLGSLEQRFTEPGAYVMHDAAITRAGQVERRVGRALVIFSEAVVRVRAGAVDPAYWPATEFLGTQVPKQHGRSEAERELSELHAQLTTEQPVRMLRQVHERLVRDYPHEWLIRYNLLERLVHSGESTVTRRVVDELLALEAHYKGEQPILTGLRHLGCWPPRAA